LGWIGPLAVTAVAAALRLVNLGRPDEIVFDETYYVKDALSLLRFGYERQAVEDANEIILDSDAAWNQLDIFTESPSFVVHPPVGKWLIATGEWAVGMTPTGWRLAVAILGILSVLMTARIIRRLTRSDVIGTLAGLLVALDGIHVVMSRTALLDISLMVFALAGFGLLLLDRDAVRRRADAWRDEGGAPSRLGPSLGVRPWRIAAGVALGLACGVKWSGLWYVALFGLMTVAWDLQLRRTLGIRRPVLATLQRDAIPAFLSIVGVGLLTYIVTWTGWLLTDDGYDRQWARDNTGGLPLVPDALRSLAEYHRAAWQFHVGLDADHAYRANAWSWPVLGRPTSFYYASDGLSCGSDRCAAEVLALGNPVLWWVGVLALLHNAWRAVAGHDWRSGALLVGYLAGWLPWLFFPNRTTFAFYTVVLVPFLAGMVAVSLAALPGDEEASRGRRTWGLLLGGAVVLGIIASAWYFLPIWTGEAIPFEDWDDRMWLPSWV
jgi:dolichyl-phosphate-mannose--protein O-mannosyl transferase